MHSSYFNDSFEKIAINISGLRSLQKKIIKSKLIRKRSINPFGFIDNSMIVRGGYEATGIAKKVPKELLDQFPKSLMTMRGKIITGKGGAFRALSKSSDDMARMYGKSIKAPKEKLQREAIGRTTLLHELKETAHGGKKYIPMSSHNSLNIILEESNLIRSLPKRYAPTKNYFKKLRSIEGSDVLIRGAYPGFKYGETKLSKAGKRHIMEYLKKIKKDPQLLWQ